MSTINNIFGLKIYFSGGKAFMLQVYKTRYKGLLVFDNPGSKPPPPQKKKKKKKKKLGDFPQIWVGRAAE